QILPGNDPNVLQLRVEGNDFHHNQVGVLVEFSKAAQRATWTSAAARSTASAAMTSAGSPPPLPPPVGPSSRTSVPATGTWWHRGTSSESIPEPWCSMAQIRPG